MTARTTYGLGITALLFLVALTAAPAFAAGGTLEPFPDIVTDCLNGDCEVSSNPLAALMASKLVHLLIAFVLLIPIANRVLFKPLLEMLDERDAQIAGASTEADEVAERADTVFGQYQEAVTTARKQAEVGRRETLDAARKGQSEVTAAARSAAEQEVAEVRVQVASAAADARAALRSDGDALARTVAEQVLGRAL